METLITADVAAAAALLQAGQTVIFPTETVYGLGADATNPTAVRAVYTAKERPADNPLIVHIWRLDQVDELAQAVPDYAYRLIEAFMPGPFTILLPKRPVVPDATTAGSPQVCLRMPSLPMALQFLEATGLPVAAPSANRSGRPSPTRWQDCVEDMNGRVGAILQGPEAAFGLESTIVDASGPQPVLLRPGAVTLEDLRLVVPDILPQAGGGGPVTPGSKYRHYAPQAPVYLLVAGQTPPPECARPGYIGLHPPTFPTDYTYLAPTLADYAHALFSFFRECDRRGLTCIVAEEVPPVGLGQAIMNRLYKASAPA